MQNSILLQNVTPEALAELIKEGVKSQLDDFKKELNFQNDKEDLLSREQVLELLQINSSTLWHWQNKGKITVYKFANKCYYKRSELFENIKPLKK
ncbi:helix-turn-helix domain-containing protein [Sabulilitoribacter arenilitoris]|uniref:Helix-turn-helix domain-containing protein n=1 Tax=Wocania arenilitoris TaxID=2044858 RepID=A0AAE3EQ10_9FLAO|nr:helix-turn-helix domain-containing protein [Wocania arenilitoris]MCF7569476.1 helix-turn-helix domain-containing protein [Wocania arenilitoris]